jgi:hypothetical protein
MPSSLHATKMMTTGNPNKRPPNQPLELSIPDAAQGVPWPPCLRARSMARSGLVPLANWKAKADWEVTGR